MSTGIPAKVLCNTPFSLCYTGKEDESSIINRPCPHFELVDGSNGDLYDNSLFYGDNFDALLWLLEHGYKGKIRLVYIDPPYATSGLFVNRKQEHAYSDQICGADFVEFLRKRLVLLRELLTDDGSIYVHLDKNMAFVIKIVMDEVFGAGNFRSFITRQKCSSKNCTRKSYGDISDYILFYTKGDRYVWNKPYEPWDEAKIAKEYPCIDEATGRRYKKVPIHAPGIRNGDTGKAWKGILPPKGKHWQYTRDKLDALDAAGEIYWSSTGNPRRKVFLDVNKGVPLQNIWLDYRDSINQSLLTTGYPTEKNIKLLELIITASSNEGDIVLDCFAGSGTTLEAAYHNKRKWIGVDNSSESIKAIVRRFKQGLELYGDYVNSSAELKQIKLNFNSGCNFSIFHTDNFQYIP